MTQTPIKRLMPVLFRVNNTATNTTNASSSNMSVDGGVLSFSAVVVPPNTLKEGEAINTGGITTKNPTTITTTKRKHLSCETCDVEVPPLLEVFEDEISETDAEEDDVSTILCDEWLHPNEFEPNKKRRRPNEDLSDLIVVLDMDECLIHFQMQDEQKEKNHNSQLLSATCEDEEEDDDDDEEEKKAQHAAIDAATSNEEQPSFMYVNEHKTYLRPGLLEFLKYVTAQFQTHIFTAGTKAYADSILDQLCLLLGNKDAFTKRWYRGDCETIDILDPLTAFCIDSVYVKPLSKVAQWAGRDATDLRRIVHIDDQPRNFLLNHGNGIQVAEWRGNNPNDGVFSELTKILKKIDADGFGDVRPHLRNESYLAIKDQLDMMHLFPHRRTQGIGGTLLL